MAANVKNESDRFLQPVISAEKQHRLGLPEALQSSLYLENLKVSGYSKKTSKKDGVKKNDKMVHLLTQQS